MSRMSWPKCFELCAYLLVIIVPASQVAFTSSSCSFLFVHCWCVRHVIDAIIYFSLTTCTDSRTPQTVSSISCISCFASSDLAAHSDWQSLFWLSCFDICLDFRLALGPCCVMFRLFAIDGPSARFGFVIGLLAPAFPKLRWDIPTPLAAVFAVVVAAETSFFF